MIQSKGIQTNKVFDVFPEYKLEYAAAAEKIPYHKEDTIEISEGKKSGSKKKKILFGSTIASTIVSAGILGMLLVKGFHGSSFTKLSKLAEKLSKDIQSTNLESTKDFANKAGFYAKKGTKKTLDGMQAVSNFTAIKDRFCDKIFRSNKVTTKFADKSKKGFKRIVDKTLGKKYDRVEIKVKDLTSLLKHYNITNLSNLDEAQKLQQVTIKGTTKTLGEWIEILSSQTTSLETAYDKGFSLGARKLRNQKRTGLLSKLPKKIDERFFKNKGLFNKKNYKTYATEDLSRTAKQQLQDDILSARKQVTNNIPNIHDNAKGFINSLSETINPSDKKTTDTIQLLKQKLEAFKSCSGANESEARKKISEEIASVVDDAIKAIKDNTNYSSSEQAEIIKKFNGIKSSVLSANDNSKGALEEIMTILKGLNSQNLKSTGKKIISDSEYRELSKLSSKISKGLKKATDLEIGEYFLKQAELEAGSAPTDILSVLFPVGAGAYAIAKGDDKDEKISAVLTTCIPLVGTFATFVYGTTKMFSGAKNLMFSMVTGAVISALGNYCDKLYKKYKASGSVAQVAKEEYDNIWTSLTPQYLQNLDKEQG